MKQREGRGTLRPPRSAWLTRLGMADHSDAARCGLCWLGRRVPSAPDLEPGPLRHGQSQAETAHQSWRGPMGATREREDGV